MDYPWMAPPFEMKPFKEMKKKDAQQHFDWYMQQIPLRIEVLHELTNGKVKLDYSKESLIDLFEWYLSVIKIHELTDEEIEKELDDLRKYPDFVYEDEKERLLKNPMELAKTDYALAMDIAIYYAQTIIKHHPHVKWTFFTKPKSHAYLNEPILSYETEEIIYERNPRSLLAVLIEYIKDNEINKEDLYDTFLIDEATITGVDYYDDDDDYDDDDEAALQGVDDDETPEAAGMNFDFENVQPFLNKLSSSIFDVGFTSDDIKTIQAEIEKMNEDNEEKEIGTFNVTYNGEETDIRIEAEIHIEDDGGEVVLYMYSTPELVEAIDEEMMKFAQELGI